MFYPDQYLHIEVLFLGMTPEQLLKRIRSSVEDRMKRLRAKSGLIRQIPEELYCDCARSLPANELRTEDELLQRHRHLEQYLDPVSKKSLLHLPADYAEDVLVRRNEEPWLNPKHILDWRERTLQLGQDLFTCAGLAREDAARDRSREYFSWPAAVSCDHAGLRGMLAEGMWENHAHMDGSTQLFPLTWSFLMNHPKKIRAYFSSPLFRRSLSSSAGFRGKENQRTGAELLYLAAWLRAWLFRTCLPPEEEPAAGNTPGSPFRELLSFWDSPAKRRELCGVVEVLRSHGKRFSFAKANDSCLDYAILPEVAEHNPGANRLLAGERFFLYRCFRRCFDDGADGDRERELETLFYLYLLIKAGFRRELIQSNGRKGFRNFSDYQDRKSIIWEDRPDYWEESCRLFIAGAFEPEEDGKKLLRSLEVRVTPKQTDARRLRAAIRRIDRAAHSILSGDDKTKLPGPYPRSQYQDSLATKDYFFVYHFIKKPLEPVRSTDPWRTPMPRNAEVRRKAERQAKIIARALKNDGYLCGRVRGIDAASHEIGCRPETFAGAFRYLRRSLSREPALRSGVFRSARYWPRLSATYHVGEDFLDLADGMRAIDEAVCFLELGKGDRLGHALAMGVQPQQYYRIKENYLYLPKQDLLDNIVWLLFRGEEWPGPDLFFVSNELKDRLENQGHRLLREIYGDDLGPADGAGDGSLLEDYYQSWKRRGEDPALYLDRTGPGGSGGSGGVSERTRLFLHDYHYDLSARKRGQQIERFGVTPDYIRLVRGMQEALMRRISDKKIAIECNPSSNKLIGTFDKYEQHPIFRFYGGKLRLPEPSSKVQLKVSVNTDDQGVFDTSLENEFALLYGCLRQRADDNGSLRLTDKKIIAYLRTLRNMGEKMTFPKAEKSMQHPATAAMTAAPHCGPFRAIRRFLCGG